MGGNGNDSSAFDHRRHPSGRLSGCDRCQIFLWRPGEKTGDLKGSPCWCFCSDRLRDLSSGLCGIFLPDSRKSPSFDRRYLCADQSIERPGIGEFPQSKKDGLAAVFSDGAKKRVVTLSMSTYLVLTAAFLWWYGGIVVLGVMAAGAVLSFFHYYQMSKKNLAGSPGIWLDISFSRQNFCWLPFLRSGIT